jgi:YHS domain-containing protein
MGQRLHLDSIEKRRERVSIMAKDVVCGMTVNEQHATEKGLTAAYGGSTYFFCSKQCRKKFNQNPQQFAGAQPPRGQKVT